LKTIEASKDETIRKYRRIARRYDYFMVGVEVLFLRRLRRSLLKAATGKVLEIAVGTGANLPYYDPACRLTGVDISPEMLERAQRMAGKIKMEASFVVMDAERLAFPDGFFDTVVSSMLLCTALDPVAVLLEMARVCRRDGRLLLFEHGRSNWEWLGRCQDYLAGPFAQRTDCHMNRRPVELMQKAGLRLARVELKYGGIVSLVEALPPSRS
jgi:ubiquinone/menaquinone biosynthesis C-methylase UbiE